MQINTSVAFEVEVPQPRVEVTLNQAALAVLLFTYLESWEEPDSWIMPAIMGSEA